MRITSKHIVAALFLAMLVLLTAQISSAQLLVGDAKDNLKEMTDDTAQAANFGSPTIGQVVGGVISVALSFLSIVFIILMITAGFRWMTAQGNEETISQAKDTIKTAVIGLILVLAAYSITFFVFKYLPFSGGTAAPGPAV